MDRMLRDNGFLVQKVGDAVLVAPSAPLERKLVEGNDVAKKFYNKIETICRGGLINTNCPTGENIESVNALITFWETQTRGLTDKERSFIGRWSYIIGRKPIGGG